MISSMMFLLAISGVSILLCRYQVWLILVFLPLNVYLAYGLISELYGPSIYDSLLADFGSSIVFYCWHCTRPFTDYWFCIGDEKEAHTTRKRSCRGSLDGAVASNSACTGAARVSFL